jgi:hypothetical protein
MISERLAAAEARCVLALLEGRSPSAADEVPLLEEIRAITPMAEERLLILAHLRAERERRACSLVPAAPEPEPVLAELDAGWLPDPALEPKNTERKESECSDLSAVSMIL